jgi:hypothetical protein
MIAMRLSTITSHAKCCEASGVIGSEKRMKP